MKNIDLLLCEDGKTGHVNDSYIEDMGIEHIKYISGFSNAETYDIFIKTICNPLIDAKKITERQNILKDFTEFPVIPEKMKSICREIQKNKLKDHDFKEFYTILTRSMDVAHELLNQLIHRDFRSQSLKDLRSQLNCHEKIEQIKSRIKTIINVSQSNNLTSSIEYGSAFKFKSGDIYCDSNGIGKSDDNGSKENGVLKFFQNFQNKIPKSKELVNGFYYSENFIINTEIDNILNASSSYVVSVISDLNRHILNFCASLSKQLSFYSACLEILKYMDNNHVQSVYPEVYMNENIKSTGKNIITKNLLDFGLLLPKNNGDISDDRGEITANDFEDSGNTAYFISGANQGGKTTFLKSIGIAQLFAQAGLKVPAQEYKCPVFNNFFTHFPKDEDDDLNFGKLAEELTRIKKFLPYLSDNALTLFNESFSTTTESEGYAIACEILRALSETEAKIFFVTHNYPLLKNRHEVSELLAHNMQIKSLIVRDGENPADRTFKIVEGEPQENINTISFFERMTLAN